MYPNQHDAARRPEPRGRLARTFLGLMGCLAISLGVAIPTSVAATRHAAHKHKAAHSIRHKRRAGRKGKRADLRKAGSKADPPGSIPEEELEDTGAATGLGQLNGVLPAEHLTLESAIEINLGKEYARLPIYPGTAPNPKNPSQIEKVWYILEDASDKGLADDLGVNYAPKLLNMAVSCPKCVQTVTEENPSPENNHFGPAVIHFQGAPDFSPEREAVPGPTGFPLKSFKPGADVPEGDLYSPFIRIEGSDVIYNAPIIATGEGPFNVTTHSNTGDRVLAVHIGTEGHAPSGQFGESWADMLFVKGFDSGQPIVYLSTDAGQPLTAVLERSTYVPVLNDVSFNGGDDFLGSARERLFGFINGQTGIHNPQAQGFEHLGLDGGIGENASQENAKFINTLRAGGDLLNVFGDFPTLSSPRHADAYSPLWDAQLGLWTPKAIELGVDKRQIDENTVLNLAAQHPEWVTGVNPATGEPAQYGSVGVDINCAVLGYTAEAPTEALEESAPNSAFPPR
jgi:hypothetical protein